MASKGPGISLANKSQLLFGFAVVAILTAALSVPWFRTQTLVEQSQQEAARQLVEAWLGDRIQLTTLGGGGVLTTGATPESGEDDNVPRLRMALVRVEDIDPEDEADAFAWGALERFREDASLSEWFVVNDSVDPVVYRYARPLRESDMRAVRDRTVIRFTAEPFDASIANPIRAIVVVDRTSVFAAGQLLINRVFIVSAGLLGSLLAILVFYLILTKLILSPVRELQRTTERVQAGDLSSRARIETGDEFEQLGETFNAMLERIEHSQAALRSMNESLDLKVSELAEANVGLFESNKLKSEFLANVSHELKTPLNSIIGFAELLDEVAASDDAADPKRRRYLNNILTSGRALLEMINELLDLAKIEAGRMEVTLAPTSIADLAEGLAGIMRPQASAKSITIEVDVAENVPVVETDAGKLQQILYNFLSNAIKFTPSEGTVRITGERIRRQDNSIGVRLGVSDTGPGIPEDMQDVIFEKFRQLDASHTREHAGTGLGLAICRELAEMLGANVSFTSQAGQGATFYVEMPQTPQPEEAKPLMG